MGLHATIIRLRPLIHVGEQRYKPYIVCDPRMVSLSVTRPLKNPGYAPVHGVKSTHCDYQMLFMCLRFIVL